jgi:Phosphoserine phosphatase RsbU, N-terminal domain
MNESAFGSSYQQGLLLFVQERSERRLQTAYEVGRAAVQSGLSVLDVAARHSESLVAIAQDRDPGELVELIDAAGAFLVEALAAFEMAQRGLTEARRAAFDERRRARMLRELSTVLTDANVALTAPESLGEVAQLVAEITREATGATRAKLVLRAPWTSHRVTAAAEEPGPDTWSEILHPGTRDPEGEADAPHVVVETLYSWNGRPVGALEVAAAARFRDDDRATVTQIAQMTSAWLERATPERSQV